MFLDRGTDVILRENACSGNYHLDASSEDKVSPGTRVSVDNLIRALNAISCKYVTWLLFPLIILMAVGAIVILAVVHENGVKIGVIFGVIVVFIVLVPLVSICCGKRITNRKMEVMNIYTPELSINYTVGWETMMYIDRWGQRYGKQTGNILLRRRDLPPTIVALRLEHIYNQNDVVVNVQQTVAQPQPPIPIFQYEAGENGQPGTVSMAQPDIPLSPTGNIQSDKENDHSLPIFVTSNTEQQHLNTENDTEQTINNNVELYQIPVHRGVVSNDKKQEGKEPKHV